jgi:hypothetical protein
MLFTTSRAGSGRSGRQLGAALVRGKHDLAITGLAQPVGDFVSARRGRQSDISSLVSDVVDFADCVVATHTQPS